MGVPDVSPWGGPEHCHGGGLTSNNGVPPRVKIFLRPFGAKNTRVPPYLLFGSTLHGGGPSPQGPPPLARPCSLHLDFYLEYYIHIFVRMWCAVRNEVPLDLKQKVVLVVTKTEEALSRNDVPQK